MLGAKSAGTFPKPENNFASKGNWPQFKPITPIPNLPKLGKLHGKKSQTMLDSNLPGLIPEKVKYKPVLLSCFHQIRPAPYSTFVYYYQTQQKSSIQNSEKNHKIAGFIKLIFIELGLLKRLIPEVLTVLFGYMTLHHNQKHIKDIPWFIQMKTIVCHSSYHSSILLTKLRDLKY